MKSLFKFLANTDLSIFIRNALNLRPVTSKLQWDKYPLTVSDAFAWRTDSGFKTKFKYSDILNLFYKIKNSWIELHIYSKDNQLLKVEKFSNLDISNEFEITSEYLNNIKDYGVFYIYHFTNDRIDDENIISNRCYLGYSQDNNLYSFVHGNTLAKYTTIYPNKKIATNIIKTSIFQNQYYRIQKKFNGFDKNQLFFTNPTSKILKLTVERKKYLLNPGCSIIIDTHTPIITTKSNCLFLRPTIFSFKDGYLDVHHA
jgi:hypothetical protein